MDFRFDILVTMNFRHAYYSDGRFRGMKVRPDDTAVRTMQRLGLLFKPLADGFRILYDTNFAGRLRLKEEVTGEPSSLRFHLLVSDPAFLNYTANLTEDISRSVFYFSNSPAEKEGPLPPGLLHPGQSVSDGDLVPASRFSGEFFSKPSGILDLELRKDMEENYAVNFSAKATFWRYILVADHLRGLSSPAILDDTEQEKFDGPAGLRLPDNRDAQVFTSQAAISLSETKNRIFRLVENYEPGTGRYKVVMAALPLPNVTMVSGAVGQAGNTQKDFSEIFIY